MILRCLFRRLCPPNRRRLIEPVCKLQRFEIGWEGRAINVAPSTAHGAEFALGINQLARRNRVARDARYFQPFEDIEVDLLMVGFGADRFGARGVPHDDIGVSPDSNRALARVEIEDLRRIRAGNLHELIWRQLAAVYALFPQHHHPIFNATGAIGDFAEIIAACGFLRRAETAMVGRRRLKIARLQAAPKR